MIDEIEFSFKISGKGSFFDLKKKKLGVGRFR